MPEPFTLSSEQKDQLVVEVARALGLTTETYPNVTAEQIATWKQQIIERDPTNVPEVAGAFVSAYGLVAGWSTDNSNPNDPQAIEGVDKSSWTFLRAGANTNQGDTLEGFMAREYTKAQFELRLGSTPSDGLINKMSNGIALNVMKSIIDTGTIPSIAEIGGQDAIVVVNEYFAGDAAAWAGNAFFHYFGTNTFFDNLNPNREGGQPPSQQARHRRTRS